MSCSICCGIGFFGHLFWVDNSKKTARSDLGQSLSIMYGLDYTSQLQHTINDSLYNPLIQKWDDKEMREQTAQLRKLQRETKGLLSLSNPDSISLIKFALFDGPG